MKGYLLLRIREIIRETPHAATFVLETEETRPFDYKPGQFLTLVFDRRGKEVRRSYSFSSTPGVDPFPMITVKQVENGEISRYLLSELKEGDRIKALPPAGRFVFPEDFSGRRDVFLLAAGSGIVPVFSILKSLLATPDSMREGSAEPKITLLYSNYNEENIIFREQIDALCRAHPSRFRCLHLLSRPSGSYHRPYQAEGHAPASGPFPQVIQGYLNNQLLERLVASLMQFGKADALFFICGPFTYMRMAQITLRTKGFREEQLRKENFVVKEPLPPKFRFPEGPFPKEIRLRADGVEHRLLVGEKETILDAALREGLELPFSCKAGACATCVAHCNKGEVKMAVNEVLTSADLAAGLILTCVAYPVSGQVDITTET